MEEDNNLLKFPKNRKRANSNVLTEVEFTPENVTKQITEHRLNLATDISNIIFDEVLNLLSVSGFDINKDNLLKDYCFISESIRSLVSRKLKLEHPFHVLVDSSFTIEENGNIIFNSPIFQKIEVLPPDDNS